MMNKTCYCLGYDILYPNVYVPIALPYLSERLTFITHYDFFATINVIHVPIALPYLSERLTYYTRRLFRYHKCDTCPVCASILPLTIAFSLDDDVH